MAFHVHRAERTDLLADGLGDLLATPQADPFAPELVLVPARGIERWLSQRLSHRLGRGTRADGVCAGVEFRTPRSLVAELTGAADDDPWSPDRLVWALLETIDASAGQPWCARLAAHLGYTYSGADAELRLGRRHSVARRIAGLFASYAAQRPQLLIDWEAGRDTDGLGAPISADLIWQAELWRALLDRVPADPPPARQARTVARLRQAGGDLPPRVSVFGPTRLSVTDVEILDALACHHDVHLWIPHPSDAMWCAHSGARTGVPRRLVDPPERGHPLLITLGRDLRELQHLLPDNMISDVIVDDIAAPVYRPDTLLGWLQSDLSANAVRPAGRRLAAQDRSVQVHSCHGPARQIDVLRDVLLAALADDPTLEPRDILVMCPDIDTYAPLIAAGFGLGDAGDGHPAHRLRVRLADRALTQTNPLLAVLAQLLDLVGGRATATEILNLTEVPAIRTRFGFTDDDLDTVERWVRESGVRWGFDQEHRAPFGLDGYVNNTWRFGLDRVLCGVAMSNDSPGWLGTTLPLDDVGSNRVELAGRFSEFADRLQWTVDSLTGARPLAEWLDLLREGVQRLTRAGAADGWQLGQLHREFADIVDDAASGSAIPLRLNDIRSLLRQQLAGRPTRANFRSGGLTVCTMVPMRSVPHRVVCLVGLDDGIFPRVGEPDGDDVLARDPVVGERDIRSEDRQLLLDAIGAAGEKLVITYTGADEYTGQPHPPCVPMAEVIDTLQRTTETPADQLGEQVFIRHPLQPFDVRNMQPGALGSAAAFTFDRTALAAARAAVEPAPDAPRLFLPEPLSRATDTDIGLDDLLRFFADPVRAFFREFEVAVPFEEAAVENSIPMEIDALQKWAVGNRMLDELQRGHDPRWALQAEWRRGRLPPGQLGWRIARDAQELARKLAATAIGYRTGPERGIDVVVDIGDGRRLTGTVSPVYGRRLVSVTYSTLGPKHLLDAWIRLLALGAVDPGTDWSAVCIGKSGKDAAVREFAAPRDSAELLADLVDIRDAGLREPIPLPLGTSHAWTSARRKGADHYRAALFAWKSGKYDGEDARPAHILAWGAEPPFAVLLDPVRDDEPAVVGEDTRLGAFAARVWAPLLAAEVEPRA